jgi:two-component system cell cycle response regulator
MTESILIVDDNEDFRSTLVNLLKRKGFVVFGAGDCAEAMEIIRREALALIVSDVRLPGNEDGIQIMSNILKEKGEKVIKTLVMTGYADKDVPIKAIKLGVDDFIYKPFDISVFLHSIETLIKGYRLEKSVDYYKLLSITDGLTNAFNHRYFHETAEKEISRAKRYQRPLSLMLIDIDDFKKFNDTYGHLAGDSALRQMVKFFLKTIRSIDLVFRYGGEEFAILCPEQTKDSTLTVAQRLIDELQKEQFQVDEDSYENISVSIGVAAYTKKTESKDQLIDKADKALYQAKELGKNRACGED